MLIGWSDGHGLSASCRRLALNLGFAAILLGSGIGAALAAGCPAAPSPVHDLVGRSFYTDHAFSQPDPALIAADDAASRPMKDFLRRVEPPAAPGCALAVLDQWATAGALLGKFNRQGGYHRKWTLAGAALAYLSLRDTPGLDESAKGRVQNWLRDVALAVQPYYQRQPRPRAVTDLRNNHAYWAGLAVAAAGVASGDRTLLAWGMGQAHVGLSQVTAQGALPMELARRRLALHYHFFSLGPLAALARLGAANGIPLSPEDDAALARLANFTFAASRDPTRIALLSGEAQDDDWLHGRPVLREGTGLVVWLTMHPDPPIQAALAATAPHREAWLGGTAETVWRPDADLALR